MPLLPPLPPGLDPEIARSYLANLGFLAQCDLPDRPGPAYLLVAIRPVPTLRHYDPELIEYWVSRGGRGLRAEVHRNSRLPLESDFAWGLIRIVDRLVVSNEYLTFGGHLAAARIDGEVIAVFTSPAPILRRGGHSQGWDRGAESAGAFFGRLMPAVDYVPGFETALAAASPLTRFAAFVADTVGRYRRNPMLREAHSELWGLLQAEEGRLRSDNSVEYRAGLDLLQRMETAGSPRPASGRVNHSSSRANH